MNHLGSLSWTFVPPALVSLLISLLHIDMALSEDWVPLNLQLHHDVPNQNYRVQGMGIFNFQTNLERTKHGDFTFTSWDVPFLKRLENIGNNPPVSS